MLRQRLAKRLLLLYRQRRAQHRALILFQIGDDAIQGELAEQHEQGGAVLRYRLPQLPDEIVVDAGPRRVAICAARSACTSSRSSGVNGRS